MDSEGNSYLVFLMSLASHLIRKDTYFDDYKTPARLKPWATIRKLAILLHLLEKYDLDGRISKIWWDKGADALGGLFAGAEFTKNIELCGPCRQ